MSSEKNRAEAERWLQTARSDLETASILLENARWAHACFHAQQAGEKALEALWHSRDLDPWGHSVLRLIDELGSASPETHRLVEDLREASGRLDRYYVPTRYPNGLPEIVPDQAFFRTDAEDALSQAAAIIQRVASVLWEGCEASAGREVPSAAVQGLGATRTFRVKG